MDLVFMFFMGMATGGAAMLALIILMFSSDRKDRHD